MKPTLFLLAAGMGSRYGGLKQLDGLGPNGETIMDYSIYDAIQAGFGKIVWVIRKDFEEQFRTQILSKYEGKVQCELCFQALDALPEGFTVPEGRQKPWGTNHAVLMGKDVIKEPFCVINCDDFYNRDAFMVIGKFLADLPEGARNQYAMVGFRVGNTLSENGTVARGICSKNDKGHLTTVVERTEIVRCAADGSNAGAANEPIRYKDEQGQWVAVEDNTPVSMNMEEHGEPQGRVLHPPDGQQAHHRRHRYRRGARHHVEVVRCHLCCRPRLHRRPHPAARRRGCLSE